MDSYTRQNLNQRVRNRKHGTEELFNINIYHKGRFWSRFHSLLRRLLWVEGALTLVTIYMDPYLSFACREQ